MSKSTAKPRASSPEENTEKRQRLIDAALTLFAERGYGVVGLREIAATADVSLGLIRTHFGSKDGLRQEIDGYVLYEIRELYEKFAGYSGSKDLKNLTEIALDFVTHDKNVLMYLRMALLEKTPGSQAMVEEIVHITRRFIDSCHANGSLQPNVDKKQAALFLVFDLLGPVLLEPFARKAFGVSMFDPDMVVDRNKTLRRTVLRGFLKK